MTHDSSHKKICRACKKSKLILDFFKRADSATGYRSKCKECFKKYTRIWRKNNKDKQASYARRSYIKNNLRDYYRKWRNRNRKKVRETSRLRKRANPDIAALHENRRRIRKLGNGGSHTIDEWNLVKKSQKHRCLKCKKKKYLTRDHIKPISKGGSDDISNIQGLCKSCNCKKYNL